MGNLEQTPHEDEQKQGKASTKQFVYCHAKLAPQHCVKKREAVSCTYTMKKRKFHHHVHNEKTITTLFVSLVKNWSH